MLAHQHPDELTRIADSFLAPFFAADVEGREAFRFSALNAAHERLSGLSRSGVLGRRPEEVFAPEDAAKVIGRFRDCARSGRTLRYVETLSLPSGASPWRVQLRPVFDDGGKVVRLIGNAMPVESGSQPQPQGGGDVLYHAALARMPLTNMLRLIETRRRADDRLDEETARLLDVMERLCLAACEGLDDVRKSAEDPDQGACDGRTRFSAIWDALFDTVGGGGGPRSAL